MVSIDVLQIKMKYYENKIKLIAPTVIPEKTAHLSSY